MKIALCISGQPRMWEEGYKYHYKNIIKDNDVTVFLHSWEMPSEQMQQILTHRHHLLIGKLKMVGLLRSASYLQSKSVCKLNVNMKRISK